LTAEDVAPPLPRLTLRDPLPPVIEDAVALRDYCNALAAGSGPVALDAERQGGTAQPPGGSGDALAPVPAPPGPIPRRPGGCCGAQIAPSPSIATLAMLLVVGAVVLRRRRSAGLRR